MNNQDKKTLTSKNVYSPLELAEILEITGLLTFGEPLTEVFFSYGKEKMRIYLNYIQHKTQVCFMEVDLPYISPLQTKFFSKELFVEQVFDFSGTCLTQFIENNPKTCINVPNIDWFTEASNNVGIESRKKIATWYFSKLILEEDEYLENDTSLFDKALENVTKILCLEPKAIGQPEKVAYLARLNIGEENIKDFITLPLNWLTKSFLPEGYRIITSPSTSTNCSTFLERTPVVIR